MPMLLSLLGPDQATWLFMGLGVVIIGIINLVKPTLFWDKYRPGTPPSRFYVQSSRVMGIWMIVEGLYLAGLPLDQILPPLKYILIPRAWLID